jgi:hypothetical protein
MNKFHRLCVRVEDAFIYLSYLSKVHLVKNVCHMKVHIYVYVCFHTICTYFLRHAAEDANDEDVQFVVQEMEPVLRGQLGHVFLFG